MLRLLIHLLGIKDYSICESCETLRQQLAISNSEKKELTEALVSIVKPPQQVTIPHQEFKPARPGGMLWSRRKAALEEADRAKARASRDGSPIVAHPDKITDIGKDRVDIGNDKQEVEDLEHDLGVEQEAN